MFRLHRLTVNGFKSFVDPLSLEFAGQGLTAIVGPNGCGKSNLADAIMWVIGERSAKHLRGSTMEDVIFNGAESRRPLGTAEVELELATEPDFPGADDGRLTLGRRVFRSGESEYRINGRRARLKDIRSLLMDTGLGFREYSVIEQGRIGQILSGKPQERRKLIEEAAGITRYRDRRRIAEVKLEEARANLARLDDLLDEVRRSLRSLKRQANAARRYRERERRFRELQKRVLLGRWGHFHRRLAALEAQLAERRDLAAGVAADLSGREAELAEKRQAVEEQAADLAERHRRQAELAATIEGRQQFLKGSAERLDEIAERLAAGERAVEERRESLEELEEQEEELAARRRKVESERAEAADEANREQGRGHEVAERVREVEAEQEALRERLLASLSTVGAVRNRLHREQVEREKGRYRRQQLDRERDARRQAREEAAEGREASAGRLEDLRAEAAELADGVAAAEGRVAELAGRQAELAERRDELAEALAGKRRRQRLLEELGEAQSERRDAFARRLDAAGLADPRFLSDEVEIPEGWERTVDLYLGELADAALVPAGTDALELARRLAEGRGTGRLLEAGGEAAGSPAGGDPAVVAPLARALGLPAELAAALPPAFLVEAPTDARRLARRHPGVAFLARGRLWAEGGALHVQGAESEPGRLARARELAHLGAEIPEREAELVALREELAGLETEHDEAADERDRLAEELATARQELAIARARHEDAEGRLHRLDAELAALDGEGEEIEEELTRLGEAVAGLEAELARGEERHQSLEAAFDRAQRAVQEARERREEARTSEASRRGRLDLLDARLESIERECRGVERQRRETRQRDAAWRDEAEALGRRQEEIRAAMDEAETALQEALERRARGREDVVGRSESLDALRGVVGALEAAIREDRARLDGVRERVSELQVEEAGCRQDAEHVREAYAEAFGEEPPAEPDAPPEDLGDLEEEMAAQRERLDRMGPVNLLAAEEYSEQEERLDFLEGQRADVADSVTSLRKTIREIDRTSTERFVAAFAEIDRLFGVTFRELFRGGEASMHLLDEEDPLESGVEIVARPPGKRQQNIMLLSGGEKALTAIALLFALFRIKPSPFCVLDEVDAPLDDVNTLRFCELLERMTAETQFVVITHNKITMERAAVLYGVTMQERGVSKVVSVKMDEVQPRAAATA